MKICFVTDSFPTLSKFGGIAAYTRTAACALAERGHEVHVLVARGTEIKESSDGGILLHSRPAKWAPIVGKWLVGFGESVCAAWWLLKLHRKHRFDVVEFPNWEGLGLVSAFLRIAPIVVRLHTSTADSLKAAKRPAKRGEPFLMWSEAMSAKMALGVVTHTVTHRDSSQLSCGLAEVSVIPHGIPIPPTIVPESSLSVLVVGPLNARKDGDTLLAAIPLVLARVPDAHFLLAGPGENDPKAVKFRAAHPDISPQQVQFLGFVSDQELATLYATCAVYASASIFESFGLTFIEAMARGKAVVGCATSAMLEVIEHERSGLLAPPSDPAQFAAAIVKLLLDPELRRTYGAYGREVASEKYSAGTMAAEIEKFFAATLALKKQA